ncbi:MAG: M28 family peptidase [Saprospiraceae bacterium]|nr:M28 family peptidase [Saprospiraceae bacterium]MBP6567008.1 M28 family peptidase [Saprospiraceae bacterium]
MKIRYFIIIVFLFTGFLACKQDTKDKSEVSSKTKAKATVPAVNADSAYSFIEKQLSFGVRVPGTDGHLKTRDWIISKMKSYGASVEIQEFKSSFLTKKDVPSYNIIAKINPEIQERIALFAHWDTRLIAEKDADQSKKDKPIDGAVDGASGVAGLLEIARLVKDHPIDLGIDFVFFDVEDQGDDTSNLSWCQGSQFWSKSVANQESKPQFGILLDLIGAKNATYSKEEYSAKMAGSIQKKVWELAAVMGKGNVFINAPIGAITDDHYYVNTIANIPCIDIIETKPSGYFSEYHHTHNDNITAIDKNNLAAVIQVVTAVAYKTSDGSF